MLELSDYESVSCLKSDADEETWLGRDRHSGSRVIIKHQSAGSGGQLLRNEYHFLKKIEDEAPAPLKDCFPKAIECGEAGGVHFLVINYIPGMSLAEYVETREGRPGIPRETALRIVREVLRELSFLHRMDPPVIHRDIKPQNIIISTDASGIKVSLIDFGIARNPERSKKASKEADTLVMGTPYFAPPEQFGYRQTDERSDLYAVGILLRYCLTQEYDEDADRQIEPDILKIIQKATEFDPKYRYQRADDMLRDVNRLLSGSGKQGKGLFCGADGYAKRKGARTAGLVLLCIALAAGGLLHVRKERASPSPAAYHFREPLIEEAVRAQLGKMTGEITEEQLAGVTSLHIFGRQVYQDESEFSFYGEYTFPNNDAYKKSGDWKGTGDISSLEDLSAMPNLREVCLYRQNISDISVLKGTRISYLGLGFNPLTDLTPLEGNQNITGLNLSVLDSEVLSVVPALGSLETLVISGMGEISSAPLKDLPLKELNLADTWLSDEEVLAELSGLRKLTLSKLYPGLLRQLKTLPLTDLEVTHTAGVTIRDLEVFEGLRRLQYDIGEENEPEILSGEPLHFPEMRELTLKRLDIESLTCLREMKKLEVLGIYDSECRDYEGLGKFRNLRLIYVREEQGRKIRAALPDLEAEIVTAQI